MERETGFSGRLLGAVRSLKKRVFPTGRELVVRKWKNDRGDQTLRLNYSLDANSVVMDMGVYRGDWAHEIHQRYGSQIHVFEPVMSFADAIKTRFSGNAAIHVHACGLASRTRTETIELSADASSMYSGGGEKQSIQLIEACAWMYAQRVLRVDLMKINIEGGEYELLEHMLDRDLVSRVDNIQVQFHDIASDSEARMDSILKRLAETHGPTYQYRLVWENWKKNAA